MQYEYGTWHHQPGTVTEQGKAQEEGNHKGLLRGGHGRRVISRTDPPHDHAASSTPDHKDDPPPGPLYMYHSAEPRFTRTDREARRPQRLWKRS